MVGLGGLEPPTSSLSGKRSNRLSYRPIVTLLQTGSHAESESLTRGQTLPDAQRDHQNGQTHAVCRWAWTRAHPPNQPGSVVREGQLDAADERRADVVEEGHDRGDGRHQDDVDDADDDRQGHDTTEADVVEDREVVGAPGRLE